MLRRRPIDISKPATVSAVRAPARDRFEIQLHPADIRRGVRTLFFSRRRLRLLAAVFAVFAGFLGVGAFHAPGVLWALANRRESEALRAERQRQGERAQAMVDRVAALEDRSEALRLKIDKIFLAYGLSGFEPRGQGGYPAPSRIVPKSIFANVIERGFAIESGLQEQLAVLGSLLAQVQAFEVANRRLARTTPSLIPLRGEEFVLTSPFGNRRSPFTKAMDFHSGIDLAAPVGTPIHAPSDAVVAFAGRYPLKDSVAWWRYGNLVVLRHNEHFVTVFGHCDEVRVRRGQKVAQGDLLGTVGNTGLSTNPHLHYEVRRLEAGAWLPLDPRIYILDHRWSDEERILVRVRSAPPLSDYQPLPSVLAP